MLIQDYIQAKSKKYKSNILHKSLSSFKISKILSNDDKTNNNNSLVINNNKLKLKLKKIKIKNEQLTERFKHTSILNKNNKNNSKEANNKSCGDIANTIAKINMDYYLNEDNKQTNNEFSKNDIILNKILNDKEKKNFFKEKEKVFKDYKVIKKNFLLNQKNKKIKKCFSQGNIIKDDLNEKNNNENNKEEKLLMSKRLNMNKIKYNIDNYFFHNPINSFNVINQNKIIYKDILNNYKGSMISQYEKSINNLNPIIKIKNDKKWKQKVRILPHIAKINDEEDESLNEKYYLLYKFANKNAKPKIIAKNKAEELLIPPIINKRKKSYLLKNIIQYPTWGFPESSIEFSFAQEKEDYIIYGGYNSNRISNLWKFNPVERSWNIIKEEEIKNESRYGHSAALRDGYLYIFGGVYLFKKTFAELDIFDLKTKNWIYPNIKKKDQSFLRRKNHIGCSIGNEMLIQGGIDEEGEFLNDCYILDYDVLQWNLPIINKLVRMPSLAYHSCCLVMPKEIRDDPKFSIYQYPPSIKQDNIKEKGLYIFGGQISKNGVLNKNVYVLKVGKKPLEWILLETKGLGPSKRYCTSMSYYELGNLLIIHGGRNNSSNYNYVLNDTFLLDLQLLNWMKVEYYDKNKEVPSRFFHQSFVYDNYFFVFGGTNGLKYLGSEILILEMDSNKRCLKELDEINILKIIKTTNKAKNNNKINNAPISPFGVWNNYK